jgi:hypothetical protein
MAADISPDALAWTVVSLTAAGAVAFVIAVAIFVW